MPQLTLAEAARTAGKSRSALLRSIHAGRISAVRDQLTGGWLVEPAELHRLYPAMRDAPPDAPNGLSRTPTDAPEMVELRARFDDAQRTIEDLRRRLDTESEERRRLTAILADQRPAAAPPARRRWWWKKADG